MQGLSFRLLWVKVVFAGLLSLAPVLGSPVLGSEPIRCAPCTPEKLSECPAVAPDCEEAVREPGCGCCLTCALKKGDLCGVYTAHCGTGLRCVPRPGDTKPLWSLTKGQAVCTEIERNPAPPLSDNGEMNAEAIADHGFPHYLMGLKPFDPRDASEAQESMKAKLNAIRKTLAGQGPCHAELQIALERIAASQQKLGDKFTTFYLPNCDKNGFYKAKQCETSLEGEAARCWCVSSWNGKSIRSSADLLGDSECQQELTH
ncbi:insulin-like growth factor-binding protein 1 [Megalops cyprinoides]|uniref:insulin-like growth factor-binding protein 1 n=1 Tax=Megalops cyprinoides TaxID=118141 RepID=UPI0018647F96|nr:insulin-like growth factor-binding protein 1 [Megalops cyprinoides]